MLRCFYQHRADLFLQDPVQICGVDIFVALYPGLYPFDHLQGGIYAHISGYQGLFQIVQHFIIHRTLPCDRLGDLGEEAFPGFLQSRIQ